MAIELVIAACVLSAVSGLPGMLLPRRSGAGQIIAVGMMVIGGGVGFLVAIGALIGGTTERMNLPGLLPELGFHFKLDPLASFFLAPIFLLGALSSIYGLRYWHHREHIRTGRRLSLLYGLLIAGLALVALAGDGVTFLFAWEIMALSAFFLVCTEDHKAEARRAGWIYLLATHVGTLTLFALFAMLRFATGSFELRRLQANEAGTGFQTVMFLVALLGFGLKAGAMPLHFWLPGAHAAAPSHVSAILSGVLLKIGIYGLLRITMLLPNIPAACGVLVLIVGVVSAVLGVVFALGQHDLKRLLAYHSIENIGIILIGLGLALVGAAMHRVEWMILGMAGCLLHVWNHCLFKSLLFLTAGSVVHATGTREIDHLGGLAKRMRCSAGLFAIGAIAICGLPPLNGFVSELIIYLGLFHAATDSHAGAWGVALAAPALAMVGALAVACFVKAYGAVFLGTPRSKPAEEVHESPPSMIAPMAVLAACCVAIGLLPILVLPLLDHVLMTMPGFEGHRVQALVPHVMVTTLGASLIAIIAVATILLRRHSSHRPTSAVATWDCGYIQSRPTIQYTASSFADALVGLFGWVLRPHVSQDTPAGLFPNQASFESHVPDIVLDGALIPFWSRVKARLSSLRVLQQGRVQGYLLYILLALFALLLSLVPAWVWIRRLLSGSHP